MESMLSSKRSALSCLGFIFVCLLITHFQAPGNDFHYDDGHSIQRNPSIRDLANIPSFFTQPRLFSENPDYVMYRPLILVVHSLNYWKDGYDPAGWIWTNLVIHGLCSWVVFLLLCRLRLPLFISLFGALVFGLHPLQTEVVNYVSARSESLAALCYLTSFYSYLTMRHREVRQMAWMSASLLLFCAGLMAKATVVTLPAALAMYEALVHSRERRKLGVAPLARAHLPYWIICASYMILYQSIERPYRPEIRTGVSQLATQMKGLVHYLQEVIMPTSLSVYQQFSESASLLEPAPILAAAAVASILGLLLSLKSRVPVLVFGLSWSGLILLPTSAVPLHVLVNDHRPYLALFGAVLATASIIHARIAVRRVVVGVTVLFAILSFQRNAVWRDEVSLWSDAARRGPLMPEAHFNLGFARHQKGELEHALSAYERAVELSPGYVRAQTNLGVICRDLGRFEAAITAFESALRSDPESVATLNNLGLTYSSIRRYDKAIDIFERALKIDGGVAEVWLNLGLAQRDLGLREKAFQSLSRAIQIDPAVKSASISAQ